MKTAILVSALLYASTLWADAAPWYRWRSAESNVDICSQIPPGDGWVVAKGPYQDAVCKRLGVPH